MNTTHQSTNTMPEQNREQETTLTNATTAPGDTDVLFGRGSYINKHKGNIYFRSLVAEAKLDFVASPRFNRGLFAKQIVQKIRATNPPGRFLKCAGDKKNGLWYEVTDRQALHKTKQALRENAPKIREVLQKKNRCKIMVDEDIKEELVNFDKIVDNFLPLHTPSSLFDIIEKEKFNTKIVEDVQPLYTASSHLFDHAENENFEEKESDKDDLPLHTLCQMFNSVEDEDWLHCINSL